MINQSPGNRASGMKWHKVVLHSCSLGKKPHTLPLMFIFAGTPGVRGKLTNCIGFCVWHVISFLFSENRLSSVFCFCSIFGQIAFWDSRHNLIFVTVNGGQSFTRVIPSFTVRGMQAHPTNPNFLAGCDENTYCVAVSKWVVGSENGEVHTRRRGEGVGGQATFSWLPSHLFQYWRRQDYMSWLGILVVRYIRSTNTAAEGFMREVYFAINSRPRPLIYLNFFSSSTGTLVLL